MRQHRTLGTLWILFGVLRVCGAVLIVLYSGTLALMWGALLTRVPNPFFLMSLFHLFLIGAVIIAIVSAFFSFLAGWALLQDNGARTFPLIAAVLALIDGPFGIALGVFTIVIDTR
jgi:hypothetical protein